MKHLVEWNRPEPRRIGGAKQIVMEGEFIYRSKCGRFEIRKRKYASGRRGHFNQVGYTFTILETLRSVTCDSLADAKLTADWEIDPNWEG